MNRRKSTDPSNYSLCGSLLDLFRMKPSKRNATSQNHDLTVSYESLEERRVLASLFPTYVNGTFTLGDASGASPYALADTFNLESNPSATKTIYLDFNGHHSINNDWDHDIMFPAFDRDGDVNNFSDAELIEIQLQFQNVAEDFLPFNVNVTTADPGLEALRKTSATDQEYGVRAVNTQPTDGFGGFGGIAFLNSFDDAIDNPVFTLNKGENNGAMTNSHEVGHALGLRHDGLGSQTYHPGVGSGEISWGPLMGAPFGENVTQWSNGDYDNSTNTEDDFAIITQTANGFDFRVDDYGSTIAGASDLDVAADFSVFQWGIVEQNSDVDVFKFETGDGPVTFDIRAFGERPNLDILARIYDAGGNIVASSNIADSVDASFSMDLEVGTYYLSVEGVGNVHSSDYGSIGFYTIDAQVNEPTPVEPVGEAGIIHDLRHFWKTVDLERTYVDPVVIFGPASRAGGDPVTIRVDNVTSNSFDVLLDEWDYRDGRHLYETVSYVVVEAGTHILADGTILHADNHAAVNNRWANVDFQPGMFASTPLVFTQTVTYNDTAAVATRARNIDTNGFQVRQQEEQGADRIHGNETVSWIAVENVGVGNFANGSQYQASQTGDVVNQRPFSGLFDATFADAPVFIAAMQSFNGGDVSTVRSHGVTDEGFTVNIEEERSFDHEVNHIHESVGIFALPSGILNAQVGDGGGTGGAPMAINFDNSYNANTDTPEAWAAYEQMLSWGQDTTPLEHCDDHEHDEDHSPESITTTRQANHFVVNPQGNKMDAATFARKLAETQSADLSLQGADSSANPTDVAFEDLFKSIKSSDISLDDAIELDILAKLG